MKASLALYDFITQLYSKGSIVGKITFGIESSYYLGTEAHRLNSKSIYKSLRGSIL
jgi:hypothetical protein